jgi:hypothetical protein
LKNVDTIEKKRQLWPEATVVRFWATTSAVLSRLSCDYFRILGADDDVVDGNVDKLDEEANEAHDGEADRGSEGNLLELYKFES